MTVDELYKWAKENNVADKELYAFITIPLPNDDFMSFNEHLEEARVASSILPLYKNSEVELDDVFVELV